MIDVLENLNEKQREAVLTIDGPVLVIAGPGSGKTRVLTHRVIHIIKTKKARPENILAVTFTNKAAQEMKNRIEILLREISFENSNRLVQISGSYSYNVSFPVNFPTICTFHSLCVKILRQEAEFIGYKKDFVIFDDTDQKALIKKIIKKLQINDEQFNPRAILAIISNAKNELKTPEEYSNNSDGFFEENVGKIYNEYQKELRESNAFDFDDLIRQTIILFSKHPKILKKYQKKFKYVLVDEYQDTNHAQYKLMNYISKKYNNIFVVGDDWQSIYKWRGADIKNILEFEKKYPGAKTILLEQSYRSTQEILDVSYSIISKNVNRKEKNIYSNRNFNKGIIVYEAADEKGEADFIVSQIAKLNTKEKIKLSEIAVLYRTNAQSRSIEETFLRYNVPYKIVGGTKFYMRKEIKDLTAYLRFIQNPSDLISFERIINVPKRGIGKATFEKIIINAKKNNSDIFSLFNQNDNNNIAKSKTEVLARFMQIIEDCREKMTKVKISNLLKFLLESINYENYIIDGTDEGIARWENVKELFTAIEKYDKLPANEALKLFIEEVALATDLDSMDDNQDAVVLMTLHSAKGLEFDTVFIIGLEEGLLPHSMSFDNLIEMEEERRLCYVGITRAKNRVNLIFSRIRRIFGATQSNYPSRFISDIPKHLFDMQNQGYSYLKDANYEDDIFYD